MGLTRLAVPVVCHGSVVQQGLLTQAGRQFLQLGGAQVQQLRDVLIVGVGIQCGAFVLAGGQLFAQVGPLLEQRCVFAGGDPLGAMDGLLLGPVALQHFVALVLVVLDLGAQFLADLAGIDAVQPAGQLAQWQADHAA